MRMFWIFIFLFPSLVLLSVSVPTVRLVQAQQVMPVEVQGFTVSGVTNESLQLKGSPSGVNFHGVNFNVFMTYYWSDAYRVAGGYEPALVVYLVSTTSSDFQVAYLYLRTGFQTFDMFLYDYNIGFPEHYRFTGQETLTSTETSVYPTPSATPTLTPQSKFQNQVWLEGSQVMIQGNTGLYDREPVYVLWNMMNVTNAWNEVWTITGNYHFVIFYTYFNKPDSVVIDDLNLATSQLTIQLALQTAWGLQPGNSPSESSTPVPEFSLNSLTLLMGLIAAATVDLFQPSGRDAHGGGIPRSAERTTGSNLEARIRRYTHANPV